MKIYRNVYVSQSFMLESLAQDANLNLIINRRRKSTNIPPLQQHFHHLELVSSKKLQIRK